MPISIYLAVLILSLFRIAQSPYYHKDFDYKMKFFKPVIEELLKNKMDSTFVYSMIANPKTHFNERYVKINVTGYLKQAEPENPVTWRALSRCRSFIHENHKKLSEAENLFGVPKESIVSILWIETRLGTYLGSNHVISVFLSTAMANKPQFIEMNLTAFHDSFYGSKEETDSLEKKIIKRSQSKSEWAMKELEALWKMSNISPVSVKDLQGSWAGAFGMPQFLPSSYNKWAVDGNDDGEINLFDTDDAIFSIANYLAAHGWKNEDDLSKKNAVYKYNNSWDYVTNVLKLAEKLLPEPEPEDGTNVQPGGENK